MDSAKGIFMTRKNIEKGLLNAFPDATRVVFDTDSKGVYVLKEAVLANKKDKMMKTLFWCPMSVIVIDLVQWFCLDTNFIIIEKMNLDSID